MPFRRPEEQSGNDAVGLLRLIVFKLKGMGSRWIGWIKGSTFGSGK